MVPVAAVFKIHSVFALIMTTISFLGVFHHISNALFGFDSSTSFSVLVQNHEIINWLNLNMYQ